MGLSFGILISQLREVVDNVIEPVPVSRDVTNDTVEEDITTIINISALQLAEIACEENYPSWSTRACEVIKESETRTLDRRNLEDIIRDVDEADIAQKDSRPNTKRDLTCAKQLREVFSKH